MRTEKEIKKLEEEIEALKASFEHNATSLNLEAVSATITTSPNSYTVSHNSQSWDPIRWQRLLNYPAVGSATNVGPYYGLEEIRVTFSSSSGSNTLASLEMECLSTGGLNTIHTMRVNYDGGARWILDCRPNVRLVSGRGEFEWSPTTLRITVRSIMPGTLEVVQI